MIYSGPAPRGTFLGLAPKSLLVFPQAKIVLQKKITGLVPLEFISGAVLSQNTACAPPKHE